MAWRDLQRFSSPGPANSLWYWDMHLNPLRVAWNYALMALARVSPSLRLKLILYRLMGVMIGRHVSVGLEVTLDVFYPHLIAIGDNSIIGYNTTILCHEYLVEEYRTGRVQIGANVTIGANCTILPGIAIADRSVVSAMSLVNADVDGFVGGVPARPLGRAPDGGVANAAETPAKGGRFK